MNLLDTASLVVTPNGYKASKLYSIIPSDGSGDMTFARTGDTATRVNSSGLIESVLANKPRLDYLESTCPKLLLEPQRTNVIANSQDFSTGWTLNAITCTTNIIASPDGNSTADKISEIASNSYFDAIKTPSLTSGTYYTASCFLKSGGRDFCYLFVSDGTTPAAVKFNITTGVVIGNVLGSAVSSKITNYGNGWYRCEMTYLAGATATGTATISITNSAALSLSSYLGDVTKGLYVWGYQLEAGAYATSYIPTTTASVTRNADDCQKTSITSLIGQTEGTIFYDGYLQKSDSVGRFVVIKGSSSLYDQFNCITRNGTTQFQIVIGNTNNSFTHGLASSSRFKIAVAYKTNDVQVYVNGVSKLTLTSCTLNTPSQIHIGNFADVTDSNSLVNSTALWKTRLTNQELATLTTI
jgi:hypothetical protein